MIITRDQLKKITYTGTGLQEELLFDISEGFPINGTIRVTGGASDVFTLQEKLIDWVDNISSSSGKIPSMPITGKSAGFKLNITTNTSGSIILEIIT